MSLSNQEIEAIAGMRHDPVYNLILDKIGCIVDDMTAEIASEKDPVKIAAIFPLWQALNLVLRELRLTPEIFATYIEKKEKHSEIDNVANEQLRKFIANSRKLYENEVVREEQQAEEAKNEDYGWRSLVNKEKTLGNIL